MAKKRNTGEAPKPTRSGDPAETPCLQLLQYTMLHVTPNDIATFAPRDPGYGNYVREFTAILEIRTVPTKLNFDITETVGLTRWGNADTENDPARFRRFRTFTNAVGMAIETSMRCIDGDAMPAHYFAISLFDDAYILSDPALLSLLSPAFAEMHEFLMMPDGVTEQAPFFLLAQMFLGFIGHHPVADLPRLAAQLIAEESLCRAWYGPRESYEFLWGCTNYDTLHDRWRHYVAKLFPQDHPNADISLLRTALLSDHP